MNRLHFRETENYKWGGHEDVLGSGRFGCVYKGVSKITGKEVAIKTAESDSAAAERLKIESEILCKCQFQSNILQFIAYEAELVNGKPNGKYVLITELCDRMSLGDKLSHPEFQEGFDEEEFRNLLAQFTAGLKFLAQEGFSKANIKIIHRDIKAHNILLSTGSNGFITYKISDFGSSKETVDDTINSLHLHGTLLNVNPKVFLTHFNCHKEVLSSNTECWPTATLLYHVLTGTLPFKFTKEQNLMEHMWMMKWLAYEKEFGVISSECVPNGLVVVGENAVENISYSLPDNLKISPYTRLSMTQLLQRMLELKDTKKTITLNEYFNKVDLYLKKDPISIFYLNDLKLISVFTEYDASLSKLQTYIEQQFQIPVSHQLLIWKGEPLEITINCRTGSLYSILQHITETEPLILLSRSTSTSTSSSSSSLTEQSQQSTQKIINHEWNYSKMKKRFKRLQELVEKVKELPSLSILTAYAKLAFDCHRQILSDHRLALLLKYSVDSITKYQSTLFHELSIVMEKYIMITNYLNIMKKSYDAFIIITTAKSVRPMLNTPQVQEALSDIQNSFKEVQNEISKLKHPKETEKILHALMGQPSELPGEKAQIILQTMTEMKIDSNKRERSQIAISRVRKCYDDLKQFEESAHRSGYHSRLQDVFRDLQRSIPSELHEQIDPLSTNLKIFKDSSIELLEILKNFYDTGFYLKFAQTPLNNWCAEVLPKCFTAKELLLNILQDKLKLIDIEETINSETVTMFLGEVRELQEIIGKLEKCTVSDRVDRLQNISQILKRTLKQQREIQQAVSHVSSQAKNIFDLNGSKPGGSS